MGKDIRNIREILKGTNIVCCECLSTNIVVSNKPFESKKKEVIYNNQEMVCKDCGRSFIFTAEKGSEDDNLFEKLFYFKDDEK